MAAPENDPQAPHGLGRGNFLWNAASSGALLPIAAQVLYARPAAALSRQPESGGVAVTLRINRQPQTLNFDTRTTLLDALRDHLGLTGTKKGADMASVAPAQCADSQHG